MGFPFSTIHFGVPLFLETPIYTKQWKKLLGQNSWKGRRSDFFHGLWTKTLQHCPKITMDKIHGLLVSDVNPLGRWGLKTEAFFDLLIYYEPLLAGSGSDDESASQGEASECQLRVALHRAVSTTWFLEWSDLELVVSKWTHNNERFGATPSFRSAHLSQTGMTEDDSKCEFFLAAHRSRDWSNPSFGKWLGNPPITLDLCAAEFLGVKTWKPLEGHRGIDQNMQWPVGKLF